MKIQIVHFGRIAQTDFLPVVAEFKKRLQTFVRIEDVPMKIEISGRDKRSSQKSRDPLLKPGPGDFIVLLDERGKSWSSEQFAHKMQTWIDDPRIKNLIFVVGPPYGFDQVSKEAAHELWALSCMTMPSDLAWLVVWEQVYRAFTVLKGMPYHHD